jgi:hypothetical protein
LRPILDRVYNPLKEQIKGVIIAHLKTIKWGNYKLQLQPPPTDKRSAIIINLLPYFWDSEIKFDLVITLKNKKLNPDTITYEWELIDIDGAVLKKDSGAVPISHLTIFKDWVRKDLAISLGYLHPNKHYKLFMKFTDVYGNNTRELMGAFTIKDRDEYYMQLLILIVGIAFSFILWAISNTGGR